MATRMDTMNRAADADSLGYTLENVGANVIRYGLVIILLSVGALKFTAYEAEGIQGLVSNSPLMSWAYSIFSVRTFSALLGIIEITLGVLIALRPVTPKLSAIGSIGSILMFLITLSFLLTTPGVWQPGLWLSVSVADAGTILSQRYNAFGSGDLDCGRSDASRRLARWRRRQSNGSGFGINGINGINEFVEGE